MLDSPKWANGKWEISGTSIMERHWHLIYTPRALVDLLPSSVNYTKFSASAEMGQGGRHWHIYIVTSDDESTIRDRLKQGQSIPAGAKGKKSLYYSLRVVLPENPEFPGEDLQRFTLGYTVKSQNTEFQSTDDHIHAGYTVDELKDAYDFYHETTNRRYKPVDVKQDVIETIMAKPQGVQAEWAEFTVMIEKEIKKRTLVNEQTISIDFFKSYSRKFWRQLAGSNELLPQSSKFKRFLASIVDKWRARINLEQRMQLMRECGY